MTIYVQCECNKDENQPTMIYIKWIDSHILCHTDNKFCMRTITCHTATHLVFILHIPVCIHVIYTL